MVELDKKFNPQNTGTELDVNLINSLPLPIYDAYKLLENQNDYEKSLQILCLSLIPWTYQYIALILSGEYLSADHEPSFEVTDSLLNMVKKPGPGKWIGFTRESVRYFMDHKTTVIRQEVVSKLNEVLNTKGQPFVKISGNENRLEYSEALINIRNRFAHSRSISGDKAKELFMDYFEIWNAWIVIIKDLFDSRLLYKSKPGDPFRSFDNRSLEIESFPKEMDKESTVLWNDKSSAFIRLYPVIVTYSGDSKESAEVAFLEEIKSKYLFYLQGENFFKLKDEFLILSKMIESKTIVEEVVTAENLTLRTFSERIDRITNQTINRFSDALKYIPEMYIDRPVLSRKLDNWLEGDQSGCIITGNPGTGKTSIITNWCIQRKSKGDHLLLMEAGSLKESDITMIIEKELNLGSPLKDCLDEIKKQNNSSSGEMGIKKFIIVIDAINEFTGKENENRGRLWREINSLISILDLYKPFLKCLVTTRNDLWAYDFPGKNTAFDILKERLYWGDTENGFPRIILGDLMPDEAGEIFEKARNTLPAMAVQSSFNELPEKTKKVLCNPFMLRLALLTYNERKVPALTKSKLERQYAKERITEENDKKKVLFTLLERMSELRKIEVTFDELLYHEPKNIINKLSSARQNKNLEKLIFDPRPKSPYQQLLRDGILEEKTDDASIKSKERIRFSQEKITDIIYSEFQKRLYKRIKIGMWLMIIILSFGIGWGFFSSVSDSKDEINEIQTELTRQVQNNEIADQIAVLSSHIVNRENFVSALGFGIFSIINYGFMILFMYFALYVRFIGAKFIKNDLPSRFIKEKFNEIKSKRFIFGMIPIFLLVIFNFYYDNPGNPLIPNEMLIYGIPIFLAYVVLWELALGVIIVLKYANSPHDAFCLFGKKEVIQSCINYTPLLPFFLLLFLTFPYLLKLEDFNSDEKLVEARKEWVSNASVISLQNHNPILYSELSKKLIESGKKDTSQVIPTIVYAGKFMLYSMLIIYPLMLVLQYYIGFWLFNLLKRRL